MIVTRFAPSPTGYLHLGHAYSALYAAARGDRFILRIEDIDTTRCDPRYEDAIYEDLSWLGLQWEAPVLRQSDNMQAYQAALSRLEDMGVLYPCTCTRKDIERAVRAPHVSGRPRYPQTCRDKTLQYVQSSGKPYALRLNIDRALEYLPQGLSFVDNGERHMVDPHLLGDVVLARKDAPSSYHLSVCVDDASQGVNLVTRGEDLRFSCHIHRVLQVLLGMDEPHYEHHKILIDPKTQRRYAKRDQSITLRSLRNLGKTPHDIREMIGFFDDP